MKQSDIEQQTQGRMSLGNSSTKKENKENKGGAEKDLAFLFHLRFYLGHQACESDDESTREHGCPLEGCEEDTGL